jgi:hypothetical protein
MDETSMGDGLGGNDNGSSRVSMIKRRMKRIKFLSLRNLI